MPAGAAAAGAGLPAAAAAAAAGLAGLPGLGFPCLTGATPSEDSSEAIIESRSDREADMAAISRVVVPELLTFARRVQEDDI